MPDKEEILLVVPTYYGATYGNPDLFRNKEEFDEPHVPVVVHQAEGVRVVLGSNNPKDMDQPDIQIERRPNGWAIFLHPVGGNDVSGLVYFLDDGRSFLVPGGLDRQQIAIVESDEQVPMIDDLPLNQLVKSRFANSPEILTAIVRAKQALQGDSNDEEHDALHALVDALEYEENDENENIENANATRHIVVTQAEKQSEKSSS